MTDELKEFLELLFATKDLLTMERLKMITRTNVSSAFPPISYFIRKLWFCMTQCHHGDTKGP